MYQTLIFGVNLALPILTLIAFVIRFMVRILHGPGLWWDDWSSLVALPFCLFINVGQIWSLAHGLGHHFHEESRHNLLAYFKGFYVGMFVYQTGIGLVKVSVLLFYRRIFSTGHVAAGCYILGALVLLWTACINLLWALHCTPIHESWKVHSPMDGDCINIKDLLLLQSIPSIVLSICILLLPIRPLWKLQMPIPSKLAVIAVFAVASFSVACTVARTAVALTSTRVKQDITYTWVAALLWSAAELDVSYICSCLPVMKPLLRCSGNPQRQDYLHSSTEQVPSSIRRMQSFDDPTCPRYHQAARGAQASSCVPRVGSDDSVMAILPTPSLDLGELENGLYSESSSRQDSIQGDLFLKQMVSPLGSPAFPKP